MRSPILCEYLPALLLAAWLLIPLVTVSQSAIKKDIRTGNRAWENSDFEKAESKYRDALGRNSSLLQANFNLGTTLYRLERFEEAATHFGNIIPMPLDSSTKNAAAYNYGNALLQQYLHADPATTPNRNSLLKKSIEAYSDALRNCPNDDDARHNLSIALQMKHEPPPPKQQQQDDKHQQDEQKHEQTLPESALREDQIDQHIPEHHKDMISLEDAERILNAIREKEMQTAEQINTRERKRIERGREFNW